MKVYEVYTSYSSTEVWHVMAKDEKEALKKFKKGGRTARYYKTFDGENDDLIQTGDVWKLTDYVDEYGGFES